MSFHYGTDSVQVDGRIIPARIIRNGERVTAVLRFANAFSLSLSAGNDPAEPLALGTIGASDAPGSDGAYTLAEALVCSGSDLVVGVRFPGEPASNLTGRAALALIDAVDALPTYYGRDVIPLPTY